MLSAARDSLPCLYPGGPSVPSTPPISGSAGSLAAFDCAAPGESVTGTVRSAPKTMNVITGAANITISARQPVQYLALLERLGRQICATAKSPATAAPCQTKCNNVHPRRWTIGCPPHWINPFISLLPPP